jgi:hypothetical protein
LAAAATVAPAPQQHVPLEQPADAQLSAELAVAPVRVSAAPAEVSAANSAMAEELAELKLWRKKLQRKEVAQAEVSAPNSTLLAELAELKQELAVEKMKNELMEEHKKALAEKDREILEAARENEQALALERKKALKRLQKQSQKREDVMRQEAKRSQSLGLVPMKEFVQALRPITQPAVQAQPESGMYLQPDQPDDRLAYWQE